MKSTFDFPQLEKERNSNFCSSHNPANVSLTNFYSLFIFLQLMVDTAHGRNTVNALRLAVKEHTLEPEHVWKQDVIVLDQPNKPKHAKFANVPVCLFDIALFAPFNLY